MLVPKLAGRPAPAFSLLEVMIVVIVIGILAAMVVPRFAGVSDDARAAAAQGALASVRAAIAAYRTESVLVGRAPFPAADDLSVAGRVLQQEMPVNPFNGLRSVRAVSAAQADARSVMSPAQYGWNYFVDNAGSPPRAVIYLNSSDTTNVPDGAGGTRRANQL